MMLFALIMVHFKHLPTSQNLWLIHISLRDVICQLYIPESTVIAAQSYLCSCLRIYVNMHESDKNRVRNIVLKYIFFLWYGERHWPIHQTKALQTLLWEPPLHTFYTHSLTFTPSLSQTQSRTHKKKHNI